jgi:hypothetical protein
LRRLIRGFQGLLVSFRAFFCPARHFFWLPGILGEVASQCLYLAAKPPMWGVDVDGLAYLSGAVLSTVIGGGAFWKMWSFPGADS